MEDPKSSAKSHRPNGSTGNKQCAIELIARGVLLRNGRVLLCQNLKHDYLFLPGGHIEFGESAATALARELHEELGVEVRVGSLGLVTEGVFQAKRQHHEINLVFHVGLGAHELDEPRSLEPHIAFEWVDLAAVQDLDVRPLAVKAWLTSGLGDGGVEWVSEI